MTNKDIARALRETAALIELNGGNAFRARAFSNASRTIDQLDERATDLLDDGTLTELPGIGSGLASDIETLVRTGSFELYEELLAALPPGLLEVLKIKGLGSKKVRRLWQELGVTTLAELEEVAAAGRVATLDGFGTKTQDNILQNIRQYRRYRQQRRFAEAYLLAQPLLEALRAHEAIERAELAGAMRRRLETVSEVTLIVAADMTPPVANVLRDAKVRNVEVKEGDDGGTVVTGALPDDFPLRVDVAPADTFGTAWWKATGAEAHVEAFVDGYGMPTETPEETSVYDAVGLPIVPPELREGSGELEAAASGTLPRLITTDDLRGTLHNHSTYSDGGNTLREMALAAREMGYEYFGICDHSQTLQIARGLSIEQVKEQQDEIRALNEELATSSDHPFRIFSGIESDILADGSLDYPDEVLASFDLIVASIHSGFGMTEEEATERVIRAVRNPYTTILGHSTGRLLLSRPGYPLDHERVIAACAEEGVAIELNANPYRLDIDWRWIRRATEQGVLISINPDAHAVDELGYVRWGVAVARKGWLTPDQCLNAKPLDAFATWLDERRATRS